MSCGATDAAIRIASNLSKKSKRVCLLDFNLFRPRVREKLKIKDSRGIFEMIDLYRKNNLMDENFLRLFEKKHGYFILTGLYHLNEFYSITEEELKGIVNVFKNHFEYIVIDVNPLHDVSATHVGLFYADNIVVVSNDKLIDLQETKRYLQMFYKHKDYDLRKMVLLINEYTEEELLKAEIRSLFTELRVFYYEKKKSILRKVDGDIKELINYVGSDSHDLC